jgi:conjugative relaxase-like TrwC/TraI family protein
VLSASFLGRPEGLRHYFLRKEREPGAQGPAGVWWGEGARILGIEDEEVRPRAFLELLRGRRGEGSGGERAFRSGRRGLDLTFSAPKSISVAALVEGDPRWIAWHEEAVGRVLRAIEREHLFGHAAAAPPSSGLLVSRFRHGLSRSGDPQLHTHALLLSRVPFADGTWRPFDPWPILRLQKILGQRYRHHLAERARSLGWSLRPRGLAFECERYPEALLASWSRRARAVEADLARSGHDRRTASARRKTCAALRTRERKCPRPAADLSARWKREALERDPDWNVRPPSVDCAFRHPDGRTLLAEAHEAGAVMGRTSVLLAGRGLVFRELEVRHTLYREALGRGGEDTLGRAFRLARDTGLLRPGAEPAGFRTPRTGWDRWYAPRGAERWIARVRALGPLPMENPRERLPAHARSPHPAAGEEGYEALLRRLVTARDLGRAPEADAGGTRLAARVRFPGRELLAAAGRDRTPASPEPERGEGLARERAWCWARAVGTLGERRTPLVEYGR